MSTEAGRGARRRTAAARYRWTVVGVIVGLAVLVVGLTLAAAIAPPRLGSASLAVATTVERPGQRLVLTASQPVAEVAPEAVAIVPGASAEVTTDGATITVRFGEMLRYATEYTVRIDPIVGAATGAAGAIEYRFTTPDGSIVTLLRGDGVADRLLRSSPTAAASTEAVYEAETVFGFDSAGTALAAIADEGDGFRVRVVQPDGTAIAVAAPDGAFYRDLRGSATAGLFGYIATGGAPDPTGRVLDNALFVVDPREMAPREITGPGGGSLAVGGWLFVPGSGSMVVQRLDGQAYLIDAVGGAEPVPLGGLGSLRGFIPGTLSLVSDDRGDILVTDLSTGDTREIAVAEPDVGDAGIAGDLLLLPDGATIRLVHVLDPRRTPAWRSSHLVRIEPSGETELFSTSEGAGQILRVCPSPNAEYLATSVATGEGRPITYLIDARSGETRRSVQGEDPDWCR